MGRYPNEICPKCKKNHDRKTQKKTFFFQPKLSNFKAPNEFRYKVYRCSNCDIFVLFTERWVKDAVKAISVQILHQK